MQKVLVLVFSDLNYDARVARQIRWLIEDFEVSVVCFKKREDLHNVNYETISLIKLTLIRKLILTFALSVRWYALAYQAQHGYYRQLRHLKSNDFDLVIANDIETLPLAFRLSKNKRVLFDAHEYAPRHFEDKKWWRLLFGPWYDKLCRIYIPRVDAMTTVCNGLADEYEANYDRRPKIITNATGYHDLSPSDISTPIRLVHHGIINKSRKIEKMIEIAKLLGNQYTLDLILMLPEYASEATQEYFRDLKDEVQRLKNVNILPPLLNQEIVPTINKYDIGLFLLEPVNFNYTYALPNKLFDFVQARLAIAIGPSIEMAKLVKKYNLGVCSETFESTNLADRIKSMTRNDIHNHKLNADKSAIELSEEENKATLLNLLSK